MNIAKSATSVKVDNRTRKFRFVATRFQQNIIDLGIYIST